MEKIIYTNSLGESITWASNSAQNRLKSFSMSPLVDTAQTSKGYQQDGYNYEAAFTEMRDVTASCIIMGNGYADMFQKRRSVKRIMNPKLSPGKLIYENDFYTEGIEMAVKIDAEPAFSTDRDNFGYHSMIGVVSMTAFDPFWHDIEEASVELVGLTDPFFWNDSEYFYSGTPFYLGAIESASTVIDNIGDVPAPLIIEWVGAATKPRITLVDTGEYIELNGVLASDQKLIITTGYGDKNVYIETISTGARVKDFSIVDPDSVFFSLPVGNCTVSLSADSGADQAAVTLKYKNLYLGV